jgi:hypothetical protein
MRLVLSTYFVKRASQADRRVYEAFEQWLGEGNGRAMQPS